MRFIADENFPGSAVSVLRRAGHDVIWVATDHPGMSDPDIFQWAIRDGRIVLTFDKDFGKIARDTQVAGRCGVILFRLTITSALQIRQKIIETIGNRSDWAGHFAVVEANRVRGKPMSDLGR